MNQKMDALMKEDAMVHQLQELGMYAEGMGFYQMKAILDLIDESRNVQSRAGNNSTDSGPSQELSLSTQNSQLQPSSSRIRRQMMANYIEGLVIDLLASDSDSDTDVLTTDDIFARLTETLVIRQEKIRGRKRDKLEKLFKQRDERKMREAKERQIKAQGVTHMHQPEEDGVLVVDDEDEDEEMGVAVIRSAYEIRADNERVKKTEGHAGKCVQFNPTVSVANTEELEFKCFACLRFGTKNREAFEGHVYACEGRRRFDVE